MSSGLAAQLLQGVLVLLAAPLLAGFTRRVRSRLLRRVGPGLLQPYRDLLRLLRKEAVVAERVLRVRSSELKAFWLGKIYRGEITAPPRALASDAGVRQRVATTAGAIGYVDAVMVDGSIKVLRIDGKLPGEPGYPLSRAAE